MFVRSIQEAPLILFNQGPWSMELDEKYSIEFHTSDASIPVQFDIHVFNGYGVRQNSRGKGKTGLREDHAEGSCSVRRWCMLESVSRTVINEPPFHATLFKPPGKGPFPAVITIKGNLRQGLSH